MLPNLKVDFKLPLALAGVRGFVLSRADLSKNRKIQNSEILECGVFIQTSRSVMEGGYMIRFTNKQSRTYRLEAHSKADRPDPTELTVHWCGSAEKIEIMRLRWDRGESLFHPFDAREICNQDEKDVVLAIKQRFERYAEERRRAADRQNAQDLSQAAES